MSFTTSGRRTRYSASGGRLGAGLVLVLLYSAAFRLVVLDRPFGYDPEGASAAQYGILARNYLRFDWRQTHGMPVLTVGHLETAPIVFYPDHPPFIPAVIVPFYSAFGVGEWQTRLPTSIITIAVVYLLYRVLAMAAGRRAGLTAAAAFAASPMTLYFGGMPDVIGTPLILFILLSVLTYLRFHARPRLVTLMPLLGAFTLAGLCDWPAYVIVPVFFGHFMATRPRTEWRWIVAFGAGAVALFAAVYVYIALATDAPWTWMLPLLARHSAAGGAERFTVTQWVGKAFAVNLMLHTLVLLVPCGLWLLLFGFRFRHSQAGATVARLLLAWGVACIVTGTTTAYFHQFMWMLLTPGIAVSTALIVEWLLQRTEGNRSAPAMGIGVALLVGLFASWTAYTSFHRLYPTLPPAPFTPVEMGQAIRAAAPEPGDLAIVIGGDAGPGSQMWFYGDRALRVHVWTVRQVQERLTADTVDLLYDFDVQPWKGTAAGIVFPRMWEAEFGDVRAYLKEEYPAVSLPAPVSDAFDVFRVPAP